MISNVPRSFLIRLVLLGGTLSILGLAANMARVVRPRLVEMIGGSSDWQLRSEEESFRLGCREGLRQSRLDVPSTIPLAPSRHHASGNILALWPTDVLPVYDLMRGTGTTSGRLWAFARGLRWVLHSRLDEDEQRAIRERLEARIPDTAVLRRLASPDAGPVHDGWERWTIDIRSRQPRRLEFPAGVTLFIGTARTLQLRYIETGNPISGDPDSPPRTVWIFGSRTAWVDRAGSRVAVQRDDGESWVVLDVAAGVVVLDGPPR